MIDVTSTDDSRKSNSNYGQHKLSLMPYALLRATRTTFTATGYEVPNSRRSLSLRTSSTASVSALVTVDDEGSVRTVMLDRLGVGAAHIAAGSADPPLLPLAQALVEEPIDGFAPLARPHPHHAGRGRGRGRGRRRPWRICRPLQKEISPARKVCRPRMAWPSRTRAMIRCSRSETDGGIFSTAAAAF